MSRLPLFWGSASDRDFADAIHAADGSSQEPVTLCQACKRHPATRTGLVTGRACCTSCADIEQAISLRARQVEDASRLRWARNAGIEIGALSPTPYTVPSNDVAVQLERDRKEIEARVDSQCRESTTDSTAG